jgi:cytochrome c551/c552
MEGKAKTMRPARLCTVLIGTAVTLALGTGWSSAASAAVSHPVAPAAATAAGALGGTWGTAEEVPGTAALNSGGNAIPNSVSCASAGNCSAGGDYTDGSSHQQAFVINETNGTWGAAEEVPGTATLNPGGFAQVASVSCASAGNCSAGGDYKDASSRQQAFVVNETNGTWGTAKEVPGTVTLNPGGDAGIKSVSCASAGNCSAGGSYADASGFLQAFVVNETNGTWGTAKEVPGTAALNTIAAAINSVSCTSAGNCSAGGDYTDSSGNVQAFVVNETNGTWGTAKEVPGTAALNQGGDARVMSVSCTSAGNCSAGGHYVDSSFGFQLFVVNETNGTWGTAEEIPGTATLNKDGDADTDAVSCGAAGNCSAVGYYTDGLGHHHAFVANETNGTWGTAKDVPGTATLNQGGIAATDAVSCPSAGNCSAVGTYKDGSGKFQVFVANETNGTWGTAEEIPGTATLNSGEYAVASTVSCASAGNCSAGGDYKDASGHTQAFVVSQS